MCLVSKRLVSKHYVVFLYQESTKSDHEEWRGQVVMGPERNLPPVRLYSLTYPQNIFQLQFPKV